MRLGRSSWPLCWLLVVFLSSLPASAWTLTQLQGRDYLPLAEVRRFYEFNLGETDPETVKFIKRDKLLLVRPGTRELYLNNLRFYLNLPILRSPAGSMISRLDLAKIVDPVLRPERIRAAPVNTVILDPGHGGNDQGTWSYYGSEKVYTLDVVARLAPLLRMQGLNVVYTRSTDTWLSLEDRVLLANRQTDAVFVSIHFNSGMSARGIETYVLTPMGVPSSDGQPTLLDFQPNAGNAFDLENVALATAIHGSIMQRIHLRDRGIRQARFHVLKGIQMPGVLIEGGYLGGEDAFSIAHAAYRQVLAESVARGIARYIAAVPDPQTQTRLVPQPPQSMTDSARTVAVAGELPKPEALVQSVASPDVLDRSSSPQP